MPMESQTSLIRRAARPLIGTMIGVGLFGLPFAVMQLGFGLGMAVFAIVAMLTGTVALLYADLVLVRGGKARFIHVVQRELGHFGTFVAGFSFLGGAYGALLAYCLFGGQFLRAFVWDVLPLTPTGATAVFFALACLGTVGGFLVVARLQRVVLPIMFCSILALVILALPYIHWSYFLLMGTGSISASIGVMVFAMHGFPAVPEARDLLNRSTGLLPRTIFRAQWVVFAIYAVFIATIIGLTGSTAPENAIAALKNTLGTPVFVFASGLALTTSLSAFMNVATSVTNTYLYDFRIRFIPSWLLTIAIPLIALLLGASSLIGVLRITGGILGSLTAIMVIIAYERARMSAELPKNSLNIPQGFVALAFILFAGVIIATVM